MQDASPATGSERRLMTKAQYASYRGVSAGAVSHWIADGKLTAPALVGDGRFAQIDVDLADAQLPRMLDPSQQVARHTASAAQPSKVVPIGREPDPHQSRFVAARAETAEINLERERRQLEAERGRYVLASAARAAWARQLGELVGALDTWMPDLADRLGAELGVDRKQVLVILRREMRAWRAERSRAAAQQAGSVPTLVADPEANAVRPERAEESANAA